MKVKMTFSNGDSQVLDLSEIPARIAAQDSINADLSTPITVIKIEEVIALDLSGFPAH